MKGSWPIEIWYKAWAPAGDSTWVGISSIALALVPSSENEYARGTPERSALSYLTQPFFMIQSAPVNSFEIGVKLCMTYEGGWPSSGEMGTTAADGPE